MSRHLLSFLLVLSTATSAIAAPSIGSSQRFARPPVAEHVDDRGVIDRATLRATLLEHRLANLERFRAYARRGVFPDNVYTPGSLNVWRDPNNHLCAAATLIDGSGGAALVEQVAQDTNFIRLADVTQGPLLDWILTSGLTQAELVAIQRPFMGVGRRERPDLQRPTLVVVDSRLRAAEDARLVKLYRQVDRMIVRNQQQSLELAVDRLLAQPALAAKLLGNTDG